MNNSGMALPATDKRCRWTGPKHAQTNALVSANLRLKLWRGLNQGAVLDGYVATSWTRAYYSGAVYVLTLRFKEKPREEVLRTEKWERYRAAVEAALEMRKRLGRKEAA